jgi:hypothetical protein
LALEKAGGDDHRDSIWSGLGWLDDNELGASMLDVEARTIWRDIEPAEHKALKLLRDFSEIVGRREGDTPTLRLNRETRPYEWAWCLMASAQVTSPPPTGHIA